jgi:hypothetical protein
MPRPISAILKMRSATIAIPQICEAPRTYLKCGIFQHLHL